MPPTSADRPSFWSGRRGWIPAASLGLSILAMGVVVHISGVEPGQILEHVPPEAHLLALSAALVGLLARGYRVAAISRGLGIPLALSTSVRAQLAGDALAVVTPSRAGSSPAKLMVLRAGGVKLGAGGALVLGEMVAEVAVLAVAALLIAALVEQGWWVALGVGGYAAFVSAGGVAAVWVAGRPGPDPPRVWHALRLSTARWVALRAAAGDFRAHSVALRHVKVRSAAPALGATVVHIASRLAVLPALALPGMAAVGGAAWGGEGVGVAASELILRPFFVLYATALLPPPGGGGGVEVVFASALAGALPPAMLAATLVWWRLYTFYLCGLLGWLYLGVQSRRPRKVPGTGPAPETTRGRRGPGEGP